MADKIASVLGGDKWKGIIAKSLEHNVGLKIGVLEKATNTKTNTNKKKKSKKTVAVAEYAFYNEFGTEDIESRPFMRNTVEEKQAEWANSTAKLLEGKTTQPGAFKNAFGKLGGIAVSDIQKTIQSSMAPENAPETIKRKPEGRTTLQDSYALFGAINYEVTDSKGKSL